MTDGISDAAAAVDREPVTLSHAIKAQPNGQAMEVVTKPTQCRIHLPNTQPIFESQVFDEQPCPTVLSTGVENTFSSHNADTGAHPGTDVRTDLVNGDDGQQQPAVLLRSASVHPGYGVVNGSAIVFGGTTANATADGPAVPAWAANSVNDAKPNRVLSGTPAGKGPVVEKKRPREDEDLASVSHLYTPIYYDGGQFNFSNPDGIVAVARPLFQELRSGQIVGPVYPFPVTGPMGANVRLRLTEVRWALEEEKQFGGRGSKPRIAYDLLSMGSTTITDRKGSGELVSKLWIPPRRKQEKGEPVTH